MSLMKSEGVVSVGGLVSGDGVAILGSGLMNRLQEKSTWALTEGKGSHRGCFPGLEASCTGDRSPNPSLQREACHVRAPPGNLHPIFAFLRRPGVPGGLSARWGHFVRYTQGPIPGH